MLIQPPLETLRILKWRGWRRPWEQQQERPQLHQLRFEERCALLVEAERVQREAQRFKRLLRGAQFRQQARVADLDLRASLAWTKHSWPRSRLVNGLGKPIVCCLHDRAALEGLRLARGEVTSHKRLAQLARQDLLILDDFGLQPLAPQEWHNLLEVMEDRYQLHGTSLTSQLPPSTWHAYLEEPTVAAAILDRVFHRVYRIELRGTSLGIAQIGAPAPQKCHDSLLNSLAAPTV